MRNAKKLIVDKFPHLDFIDTRVDKDIADELFDLDKRGSSRKTEVTTKSRNSVSLGKFVNKLLPGKYSDKDREDFVNSFKASIEQGGERFQIVEGDDIAFWYNSKNYKEKSGTLGNSCMAEKSGIFDIYVKNPGVCRMLILTEDDKLIGRALVWKLNSVKWARKDLEGVEYFMDRQYTIKDSDVNKFRNYAKEQGWSYKSYNNHHSFNTITVNGEEKNVDITVQVGKANRSYDYGRYPYMDTFRRYDPSSGILYNDDESDSQYEGQYLLQDTGGGYEEIQSGVYSEWYDRTIPDDEAVWSDGVDSYLFRDRAVRVETGSSRSRGWWPEDYDDIVFDEWIDEYLHVRDAVYSESYSHYLYDETAIEVITEVYDDGSADKDWLHEDDKDLVYYSDYENNTWHDKLYNKSKIWGDTRGILKELLIKDYNDNWILKIFQTKMYRIIGTTDDKSITPSDITGTDYLTKVDAYALGYDLDLEDFEIVDQFEYNELISSLLPELLKKLKFHIKRLNDMIEGKGQTRMKFSDDEEYIQKIEKIKLDLGYREQELENGTYD